ncbi:cadherin-like domain-containing protein [Pseudoscourfieldia marina]
MVINPIKVKVIACDNFTINTYVFNAKRSDGNNSKLCGITADRGAGINPFHGNVADQTLYIPSYEDGLGGTAQIKTTTCDPYADVSWTYYGCGSQDGSATFPLPLPAHTGTTEPEVSVYVHVTAQNGAATTTYKLKVVHVIGKTATLDGVIVRGYACATYPCMTRTATVPGMETKSARRALAADEASTYGGETSNATRRMLLATPSCDGSGCQTARQRAR